MTVVSADIKKEIDAIIAEPWDFRDGQIVPETTDVALAGAGVKLNAAILYADLADSTSLAMYDKRVAARVFKAFLAMSTRLILDSGGSIRSFDGDRVMGIYLGNSKCTSASRCALKINWVFQNLLKPKFDAKYEKLKNGTFKLAHCTGIDVSEVLSVRAGIRNNNDLIWVGRAPNVAAKLSAIRDQPYNTFITGEIYDLLADEAKFTTQRVNMWEERLWKSGPVQRVYRSSFWWGLA